MRGHAGEPSPGELLRQGLERLSAPDPAASHSLLERYLDELERWNSRFGLVGTVDRRDLVVRHVLDSLAPWRLVAEAAAGPATADAAPASGAVLDVGSGAGFPGIPLAILLPSLPITLLERSKRRSAFLKTCSILLGLSRVAVLQVQLSEARGDFGAVTFRAVAPLERFVAELERSAVRARAIIAYKGKRQRAQEEVERIRRTSAFGLSAEVVTIEVPFLDEERCVVVLRPSNP